MGKIVDTAVGRVEELSFLIIKEGAFMRQWSGWVCRTVGLAGLVLAFVARPAAAQTAIYDNQSITASGVLMTVTGCFFRNNTTAAATACDSLAHTSSDQMTVVTGPRGTGASILINHSGGTDLLVAPTNRGRITELKFTLTVNASTLHPINMATLSDIIVPGNNRASVSLVENNFLSPWALPQNITITSAAATGSGSLSTTGNVMVTTPFALNFDLKLTSTQNSNNLKLSSVTLAFRPAPEPLSIGVFMVGLAGLGAARRAKGKTRKPA